MRKPSIDDVASTVWAKSDKGDRTKWLPLQQHAADAVGVMGFLVDHWLAPRVKVTLQQAMGDATVAEIKSALQLLAGVHDCGKITPAFSCLVPHLASRMTAAGLPVPLKVELTRRRETHHSLAGQIVLERYLREQSVAAGIALAVASIIGAHHGYSHRRGAQGATENMGPEPIWHEVQVSLIQGVEKLVGVQFKDSVLCRQAMPFTVQSLMCALVIVADWLASDESLHPYFEVDGGGVLSPDEQLQRSQHAWSKMQMSEPWAVTEPMRDANDYYLHVFGFTPNPLQIGAFEAAQKNGAGLYIVEAPMGVGKTEAAFSMSHILAQATQAGGLTFALPTMATTNAMFSRVLPFLNKVSERSVATTLMHSKAELNEEYAGLFNRGLQEQFFAGLSAKLDESCVMDVDHHDHGQSKPYVTSWLKQRKKRSLANIHICTIDQILFAALKSKHVMLRHIGLASNVVVIDEVHSADPYMREFLKLALEWLGEYKTPVILMSATLPNEVRTELIESYSKPHMPTAARIEARLKADGVERREARRQASLEIKSQADLHKKSFDSEDYPLVTFVDPYGVCDQVAPEISQTGPLVAFEFGTTNLQSIQATLCEVLTAGGCALVIKNTVRDAQELAKNLQANTDLTVTLNHSRFTAKDRLENDAKLVALFGKGREENYLERPSNAHRHVIVATQVAEQSLDIDFDVLLTDIAPMDALLQRVGRLHRHPRAAESRPVNLQAPRCVVLVSELNGNQLPVLAKSWGKIYTEFQLFQTYRVLQRFSMRAQFPADIARLVEAAAREEVPEELCNSRDEYRNRVAAASDAALPHRLDSPSDPGRMDLCGITNDSEHIDADDPRSQTAAKVRQTDETLEVILMFERADGSVIMRPDSPIDAPHIDIRTYPSDALAREISSWSVSLPYPLIDLKILDKVIEEIWKGAPTSQSSLQLHPLLRGKLMLHVQQQPSSPMNYSAEVCGIRINYSRELGLTAFRIKAKELEQ